MAIYNSKIHTGFGRFFYPLVLIFILNPYFYIFRGLKVIGKENIPKNNTPLIIMPNHLSNLDPPLVASALFHMHIAYMAKEELFRHPILRWLIINLGAFSVNREKVEKTSIKAVKEILKNGWSVGIFLEGKRNKNPEQLGEPNSGPAFIANLNKVNILPVGIIGSNKKTGTIKVIIGKPFKPDENMEQAKKQCARELCNLTGQKMPG